MTEIHGTCDPRFEAVRTTFAANFAAGYDVGAWIGSVFQSVLEAITFLGAGTSPLTDESKAVLDALDHDVSIEVLGAMYDPYSAHLVRLLFARSRFDQAPTQPKASPAATAG